MLEVYIRWRWSAREDLKLVYNRYFELYLMDLVPTARNTAAFRVYIRLSPAARDDVTQGFGRILSYLRDPLARIPGRVPYLVA